MKIQENVLKVLSACTMENNVIKINNGQLDRKLYVAVNKVLEAMGGKWNRKLGGHLFPNDPSAIFEQTLLIQEIKIPQDFGYYPTPRGLADHLVSLANIRQGMLVLEPSAGQGTIAEAVEVILNRANIDCIELLPNNVKILAEKGFQVQQGDFLTMDPSPIYDRVIMNPPFERQQDIDHVFHAYKFLKPNGILVSIMSLGFTFRENKKSVAFRDFIALKGQWHKNLEESFKVSGTLVNTVTAILKK